MDKLDKETFKRLLPKGLRGSLTDELVDRINSLYTAEEEREVYLNNLINFTSVLKEGHFRLHDYVSAVTYVTNKLRGDSNQVAYAKTFPDRYAKFVKEGKTHNYISGFVSSYNKNKLVVKIMEQTLVPAWVVHHHYYHEAVVELVTRMRESKSDRVRIDAADRLLAHLKPPEATKIQLDIGMNEGTAIQELRERTRELADMQKKMLESKTTNICNVADMQIITDAEYEEVKDGS